MSRANVATPPGIVELSSDNARVAFVPALGGRIIALDLGGRQWLADGDRGGLAECFPTVAGCTISSGIPSLGGHTLAAGGDIASRAPSFTMETHDPEEDAAALRAVTEWTGERAPWRYARELRVMRPRYATGRDVAILMWQYPRGARRGQTGDVGSRCRTSFCSRSNARALRVRR